MFGDVGTVSEDTNSDRQVATDASAGWPQTASAPLSPSAAWSQEWEATSAPAASPPVWETALRTHESESETAAFAGWGAFSSTDSVAVNHDMSSWDSPTDAAIAEASTSPWPFETSAEAPPLYSEPDPEPDHMETANTEWDVAHVDHVSDYANPVTNHSVAQSDPIDSFGFGGHDELAGSELVERPGVDIWADAPPAPTLPASFLSGSIDDDPDSSRVPFYEIATALAAADTVPLAARTAPTALAIEQIHDANSAADATPGKRRGRLAARMARDTLEKNAEEVSEQAIAAPEPEVSGARPAKSREKKGAKFFAKKGPSEPVGTDAGRETPKVLRIAALVSLLVGVGLFGFTVITSRDSDQTPEIAPPISAAPVSVPESPAVASTAPVVDPVFGADPIIADDAPAEDSAGLSTAVVVEAPATDDLSFSDPVDFSN